MDQREGNEMKSISRTNSSPGSGCLRVHPYHVGRQPRRETVLTISTAAFLYLLLFYISIFVVFGICRWESCKLKDSKCNGPRPKFGWAKTGFLGSVSRHHVEILHILSNSGTL